MSSPLSRRFEDKAYMKAQLQKASENSRCSTDKYWKFKKIGQGTFGEVYRAEDRKTGNIVALKKLLNHSTKDGISLTSVREINILQTLKHKNIVNFIEVCQSKRHTYMVLDFCDHDLAGLLSNINVWFSVSEIKMMMKQILNGLFFIHGKKYMHRDIKTSNILVTKSGELKIADFGLARAYSSRADGKPNRFTNTVVTLWYRPPEILLGDCNYTFSVDIWGAGCIMAELCKRSPLLRGESEQHQLILISHLCGSITPENFPGVEKLDLYGKVKLPSGCKRKLADRLKGYVRDRQGMDLLEKLLTIDPAKRIDADTALDHDYFWTDPFPCELKKVLSQYSQSMFGSGVCNKENIGVGPVPKIRRIERDANQYCDIIF